MRVATLPGDGYASYKESIEAVKEGMTSYLARTLLVVSATVLLGLAAGSASPLASEELLTNPGFEEGTSGWTAYGGTLSQTDSPDQVYEGDFAAVFTTNLNVEEAWVYQVIEISPDCTYTFSGWVLRDDFAIDKVYLRIRWYESEDGFGAEISHVDSDWLTNDSSEYQPRTVEGIAPQRARSARASIMLDPVSVASVTAYFDDIACRQAPSPQEPSASSQ